MSISLIQSCFCTNLFYDSCALDIIQSPNFLTQSHCTNKEKNTVFDSLVTTTICVQGQGILLVTQIIHALLVINLYSRIFDVVIIEQQNMSTIIFIRSYSIQYKNEIWNRKFWKKRNYRWFPVTDMNKIRKSYFC